jgi:glycosyltransferase involved in cell wall biosynthesis
MIHERFPSYFSSGDVSSYNKRKCIEKASHIIAISEATKTDIQYYHNIPPEKITVIYHGFEYTQTVADQYAVDHEPYLLYVGDREGYKNFSTFLLAVAPILKNQPNLKLICAGGGEFRSAERELILRLGIESSLSQCNVDDKELADLYTNAIAFIYPSLSEGFGLPLLEAFKAKCPVIASDIPCFREVGDSALCYFDPYNVNHMSTVIQQVIADKELQLSLKISGEERLSKFSIDDCIDNTIKLYQSLV